MSLEILKKRVGYQGKPQQWRWGFDLAVRELHHPAPYCATTKAIHWFESQGELAPEAAEILAGLKQMYQPTHTVNEKPYTLIGTSHGAGLSRGDYIYVYLCVETGRMYHRHHVDFTNRVKPVIWVGVMPPKPLPFKDSDLECLT